jgi:CheY-like chemotaxis protein
MMVSGGDRGVVADDDADILDLVSLTLERAATRATAPWTAEALELVLREQPDVAVLDVAMPKLDGAREAAVRDPGTGELRIVLLTARVPSPTRTPASPRARTNTSTSRSASRSSRTGWRVSGRRWQLSSPAPGPLPPDE